MLITLAALAIVALSAFVILGGLRMVAQDTVQLLSQTAVQARRSGEIVQRTAFASLWAMIFALSYF